ncbi:hypothetical protein TNCV_1258261 [Trichonephila clavipes]|nr:hypothetical protein TNCV_1258261 [Trichonephila clavipes]
MLLHRQCQIEAPEVNCGKELVLPLSLAVVWSTMQETVRFGSVPLNFGRASGVIKGSHLSSLSAKLKGEHGSTNV